MSKTPRTDALMVEHLCGVEDFTSATMMRDMALQRLCREFEERAASISEGVSREADYRGALKAYGEMTAYAELIEACATEASIVLEGIASTTGNTLAAQVAKRIDAALAKNPNPSDVEAECGAMPPARVESVGLGPEPQWEHGDMCGTVFGGQCNCYVPARRAAWLKGEWPPRAAAPEPPASEPSLPMPGMLTIRLGEALGRALSSWDDGHAHVAYMDYVKWRDEHPTSKAPGSVLAIVPLPCPVCRTHQLSPYGVCPKNNALCPCVPSQRGQP